MSKMSPIAADLMQSLGEALAHAQGRPAKGTRVYTIDVDTVDAKEVRRKMNLTQDEMAAALGTSPSGYKKWEQGVRAPSGAAKTLLRVMEKEPEAVIRALTAAE